MTGIQPAPARGYFITGTDTGVGKTLVACALLHAFARAGHRAVGMKPVAAGAVRHAAGFNNEDVEQLRAAGNVTADSALINPVLFRAGDRAAHCRGPSRHHDRSRAHRSRIRVAFRGRGSSRCRGRGWILRAAQQP